MVNWHLQCMCKGHVTVQKHQYMQNYNSGILLSLFKEHKVNKMKTDTLTLHKLPSPNHLPEHTEPTPKLKITQAAASEISSSVHAYICWFVWISFLRMTIRVYMCTKISIYILPSMKEHCGVFKI